MTYPDFVVIGAAKAGTTSLCSDLSRHPGIFICDPKEPEYFCRDENYAQGDEWYAALFADSSHGQLCGEGSTMYSNCTEFPLGMLRMQSLIPDAKIVYMVREPVARAYSHWLQIIKNQDNFGGNLGVSRDFDLAIQESHSIVSIGDYQMQVEHVLNYYPRESIHVIVFEEYVSDRLSVISRLCDFLGVESDALCQVGAVWENKSESHFRTRAMCDLADKMKRVGAVRAGRKVFPKKVRAAVLDHAVALSGWRRHVPPAMSGEARADLIQRYSHVRPWLEGFLGRALAAWDEAEG
ncbi:MAG: sulfotransferase domain-containing protein [Phycisphaerales bacterium JB052]